MRRIACWFRRRQELDNSDTGSDDHCNYHAAEHAFLRVLRSEVNGHIVLPLRCTLVCIKALCDRRGLFGYVVSLAVDVPVNRGVLLIRIQGLALNDIFLDSISSNRVRIVTVDVDIHSTAFCKHDGWKAMLEINYECI